MTTTSRPHRRWLLYGLRTLVVVLLLACVGRVWITVTLQPVKKERAAAAAITAFGGSVSWTSPDSQGESPRPGWLRTLLGDDFYAHPDTVAVSSDAAMEYLGQLRQVRRLILEGTLITDAGFEHLKDVSQLEVLHITGTPVTETGLAHLRGLTQLRELWLMDTQVTDAGLEQLTGLTQLQQLSFAGDQVTAAGLEHVSKLTQLRKLRVHGVQVAGTGLEQLKALTRLDALYFTDMPISDRDVRRLRTAMPHCSIIRMALEDDRPMWATLSQPADKDKAVVRLLLADAVQKDLDLTADQIGVMAEVAQFSKEQIRELALIWHETSVGNSEPMPAARVEEFAARAKVMETRYKELQAKVVGMLTAGQRERLSQIQLQYAIAVTLLQPSLIKALGISDGQLDQIRQHAKMYALANPELLNGLDIPDEELDRICPPSETITERAGAVLQEFIGLTPTEILQKWMEISRERDTTLAQANRLALDVLTPEQRATLDQFVGEQIAPVWDYDASMPTN